MICSPSRQEFIAPVKQVWRGNSIYSALRDAAIDAFPNDFNAAFHQLCDWAKHFVRDPNFKTWATDFRRAEERDILTALAALDVEFLPCRTADKFDNFAKLPTPHSPAMDHAPEPTHRELEPV